MNDRVDYKKELLDLFESNEWESKLDTIAFSDNDKEALLWAASDLAKEGKISEALKIAKYYALDTSPRDDEMHKRIISTDDSRSITTVRGVVCWVLSSIVSKLETAYYPEILNLLEGKEDDTDETKRLRLATGDNFYIRTQACFPLEGLVTNMRAVKNPDGTPFDFGEENRIRSEKLAFRMLEENKDNPRVLEALASVFGTNGMRSLNEESSINMLRIFIFNSRTEKYNPNYVIERIIPLVIYFAEFRDDATNHFNNSQHTSFLKKLLREASPRIRSSIIWHFCDTLKREAGHYRKLEKYIPIILELPFNPEVINQLIFLVDTIIEAYPIEGTELFKKALNSVRTGIKSTENIQYIFLSYTEKILPHILKTDPETFNNYLEILYELWVRGVYIGEIPQVLGMYKQAPQEYQLKIKQKSQELYNLMKEKNPRIAEIIW